MSAMIEGEASVRLREHRDLLPPAQVIPAAWVRKHDSRSLSVHLVIHIDAVGFDKWHEFLTGYVPARAALTTRRVASAARQAASVGERTARWSEKISTPLHSYTKPRTTPQSSPCGWAIGAGGGALVRQARDSG